MIGWRLLVCVPFVLQASAISAQHVAIDKVPTAPVLLAFPATDLARPVEPVPPSELPGTGTAVRGPAVLPQIVRSAGIIFSGRVTFVGRGAPSHGQKSSSTLITFQVEDAIRGTFSGQNLTIHEWAGLWSGGERYRVGEHVFLFLYPPSRLGLTSPVAGLGGRFTIGSQGAITLSPHNIAALAADPVIRGRNVVPYGDLLRAVRRVGDAK